jgi:hypothetical protein
LNRVRFFSSWLRTDDGSRQTPIRIKRRPNHGLCPGGLATPEERWYRTVSKENCAVPVAAGVPAPIPGWLTARAQQNDPGSGLGLSTVAAIVELHHAAIELLDNAPGLRVVIRFPARA